MYHGFAFIPSFANYHPFNVIIIFKLYQRYQKSKLSASDKILYLRLISQMQNLPKQTTRRITSMHTLLKQTNYFPWHYRNGTFGGGLFWRDFRAGRGEDSFYRVFAPLLFGGIPFSLLTKKQTSDWVNLRRKCKIDIFVWFRNHAELLLSRIMQRPQAHIQRRPQPSETSSYE